jgi:toxin-antitoxin system PIN domain toxin
LIIVDVNVLVALARLDHPDHARARQWWQERSDAGETITTPDLVWVGVVRILTHPRAFEEPSTVASAFGFMHSVTAQRAYLPLRAAPDVMADFEVLCTESGAGGNLATDAYIAAVARRFGARVATFDRDFRRFRGVELDELA